MGIDSVDFDSFDPYVYGNSSSFPVKGGEIENYQMLQAAYFALLNDMGTLAAQTINTSSKSNPEIAKILIEYGNNPKGWPAICYAVFLGKEDVVKILVEHGVDVNTRCSAGSVMDMAVDQKNISLVKFLAAKGATVDQAFFDRCFTKGFYDGVLLYFSLGNKLAPEVAAQHIKKLIDEKKPFDLIKAFVEHHKDELFKKDYGISGHAIQRGDANFLKYLVEKGMRIDTTATYEHNVIFGVVKLGRVDLLTIIFSTGAKVPPLVRFSSGGNFPRLLWEEIFRGDKFNYEMIALLLKNGLPVDHDIGREDRDGSNYERLRTPLHQAIMNQNPQLVRLLLENGADANLKFESWAGSHRISPLRLAIDTKNKEIVELLLCHGAKIDGTV